MDAIAGQEQIHTAGPGQKTGIKITRLQAHQTPNSLDAHTVAVNRQIDAFVAFAAER